MDKPPEHKTIEVGAKSKVVTALTAFDISATAAFCQSHLLLGESEFDFSTVLLS